MEGIEEVTNAIVVIINFFSKFFGSDNKKNDEK